MKFGLKLAPALLVLGCLSGCFSMGRTFPSDVNWIAKGKTNRTDVERILGNPNTIGNSGGVPTSSYSYYRYDALDTAYHKELKFYWNEDHSVRHFNFNSSFPSDVRDTPQEAQTDIAQNPDDNQNR